MNQVHGQQDEPMWGRMLDGTRIQIRVAVHGIKQGANAWWRRSVEALQGLGYSRMSADAAAYVAEGVGGVRKFIHSHVNHFTMIGPPGEALKNVRDPLR
jgi:hypothetical protein